jgi:hypothetical protein
MHLVAEHRDEWITSCDLAGIEITAKTGTIRDAVNEFRQEHGQDHSSPDNGTTRIPYTKDNFVDAVIAWVTGNDQVQLKVSYYQSYAVADSKNRL